MKFKIDCAATGYRVSARPDVWQKRIEKMGTTEEGIRYDYISKEGLKKIKEIMVQHKLSAEKALAMVQRNHGLLDDPISTSLWPHYLEILEDKNIVVDFEVISKPVASNHIKEEIETIEI